MNNFKFHNQVYDDLYAQYKLATNLKLLRERKTFVRGCNHMPLSVQQTSNAWPAEKHQLEVLRLRPQAYQDDLQARHQHSK